MVAFLYGIFLCMGVWTDAPITHRKIGDFSIHFVTFTSNHVYSVVWNPSVRKIYLLNLMEQESHLVSVIVVRLYLFLCLNSWTVFGKRHSSGVIFHQTLNVTAWIP